MLIVQFFTTAVLDQIMLPVCFLLRGKYLALVKYVCVGIDIIKDTVLD